MKTRFLTTSLLLIIISQFASAQDKPLDAPARVYFKDKSHEDVYITQYKRGFISYKLNQRDLNRTKKGPNTIQSIYFYEAPLFTEAMQLYKGRKFSEARTKFLECEKAYRNVDTAPNNFASLAGFHALECSRRMFDLKGLSEGMEKFRKDGLTRQSQLQQLEVNAFWEAVRLKDWSRLDLLAKEWRTRKVTGSQRAQISYCHGLAYEELSKDNPKLSSKALNAYNTTLSVDFTASMEIVVAAASNALRIYANDVDVKQAISVWKTEDENQASQGYQRLIEANALAKLYNQAGFNAVKPLSAKVKVFLKYNPSNIEQ